MGKSAREIKLLIYIKGYEKFHCIRVFEQAKSASFLKNYTAKIMITFVKVESSAVVLYVLMYKISIEKTSPSIFIV